MTDTVTVTPIPVIGIDKTSNDADGQVDANQVVTFTILGKVAQGPVTGGTVTDTLPVGETYVSGSEASSPAESSFTVSADGRTLTWTYASLNSGDPAVTITYDVTIGAGASGDLVNVAELCVSELPDCVSADETVTPIASELGIQKSNDAPLVADRPRATARRSTSRRPPRARRSRTPSTTRSRKSSTTASSRTSCPQA